MLERVIVVSTSFPRVPGDAAGHFVRSDALRRAEAGHEVHVVCPDARTRRRDAELVVHGVGGEDLFAWPGAWTRARERPARLGYAPGFVLRARRLVRELGAAQPSRLVAHWALPSAWPIAVDHAGPLEIVSHGADIRLLLRLPFTLRSALVKRLLGCDLTWVFVSSALREQLSAGLDGPLAARLEELSHVEAAPIDVPPRHTLPALAQRYGLEPAGYAVWVGRDIPSKRLDLALEAAELARVPLAIVGATRRSSSARVHSLGTIPRLDALSMIAHARLLLSTSALEGAPTAVREARALGVPVVACEAGDLRRWAEADPGITLVAPEAAAIAGACVRTWPVERGSFNDT